MSEKPFKKGRKRSRAHKEHPLGKYESILENGLVESGMSDRHGIFASAAGLCSRQTAGLMMAGEQPYYNDATSQFYFKMGSTFEAVVERGFRKQGYFIDAEPRVESIHPDFYVSGRIDFVIADPDDEAELLLVELKSCGELPTSPRPYQLAQLKMYMVLTGMPKGLLWYISRHVSTGFNGRLKQKVFEVTLSDHQRRFVLRNWLEGAVALRDGWLPPVPEHMKKYKCGFCLLKQQCWDNVTPLVAETDHPDPRRFATEVEAAVEWYMSKQQELRDAFYDIYGMEP